MPTTPSAPVVNPAGYLVQSIVAVADGTGMGAPVTPSNPLAVSLSVSPSGKPVLSGTTAANLLAGPFVPVLGRAIWLQLDGSWSGSVQLMRSVDAGVTLRPLTLVGQSWALFTANVNEAVAEESVSGATYYLDIKLTGGTLSYRVEQ